MLVSIERELVRIEQLLAGLALLVLCGAAGIGSISAPAAGQAGTATNTPEPNATGGQTTDTETESTVSIPAPTASLGAPAPNESSLPDSCAVTIRSQRDFERLDSGEVGCIPGNETIHMRMSRDGTVIPDGARLVSNGGTLVYNRTPRTGEYDRQLLLVLSDRTTLRGVNVVGPIAGREQPVPNGRFGFAGRNAIRVGVEVHGQGVEIGSVTVRGWPAVGVALREDATATIHHARIVGQYTGDRGYGVSVIDNADAYIAASYFDRNRHSVEAGDNGSYTVADSVIGPESVSHSLDVHPPAGGHYEFRNLTVMNANGLAMRQIPKRGALVENVWFTQADPAEAIYQLDQRQCNRPDRTHCDSGSFATAENGYDDFRNMRIRDVHFGADPPPGIGAPPSMPAPSDIPNAPIDEPVDDTPFGGVLTAIGMFVALLVGIVILGLLLRALLASIDRHRP